ncbi:hypothetical protein HZS61_011297 [Fusarium oxysporum f. sp. conglutinans]|uniref:Vacuolar calcium ion transporter n=2 Tax=Fusarium oxysporum TaxID=5507 RepID=A0A8H6GXH7_FUSOX|nr:hypothetical protein HZS61_011297 [Fusarium oxysporum f. sp. conglutinans]
MASSSQQRTDFTSQPQMTIGPTVDVESASSEVLNFDCIFRATYPKKGQFGPSGKRRTKGAVVYECLLCSSDQAWSNPKRDNAMYHAKRKHRDIVNSSDITVLERSSDMGPPLKQARLDNYYTATPSESALRKVFNPQRYTESMVGLLTHRRLPFSAVTWDEMQDVMLSCNPAIEDLIMTSRHEAMRHITANFSLYQSQLKAKLQSAVSKVHISSDLWTSPHRHGVLAVCARWVDEDYQLRRALLSLPEIRHSHSGEHQSRIIFSTLDIYDIANQLGCHTGDNAASNDTCLQHLSTRLRQDRNINWDPKRHRIRCILHVINLSLQAFLFASSREALQAALDAASDITEDELYEPFGFILNDASGGDTTNQPDHMEAQTGHTGGVACKRTSIQKVNPPPRSDNKSDNTRRGGWIMVPALRKLHRIGLWLRNSPIHSDAWDERIKLRLGIDNDTRWNSWHRMIDNLIRKKQQVKQFLLDYDKALGDNILTSSDWDYLEKTHAFLQPFTSTTLWAQGVTATLSQNLMIMDILLRHYEQKKELYEAEETHDPLTLHSIDMGWFVLDKYYALSGESPIYATALLLDPSKRARYLEINWKGEWVEAAIRDALSIWEEEYKMAPTLGPAQALSEASRSQQGHSNELDRLLNEIMVAEDITRDVDDFENFIHNQPIKIEGSPLIWWCQRDQVRTYPRLSRMAIDILSVPPGSADPEQVCANPGLYYEGSPLLHVPPVDEERHGFIRRLFDGASTPGKDSHNRLIKWPANTFHITKVTLMSNYVNVLLPFVPLGIIAGVLGWSPAAVFSLNFIAIIPLAGVLSFATEEISIPLGETLGGLLNATFGNAVELIVSIVALKKNQIEVVQSSMLGSILSNLLLVMGSSFLLGGLVNMKDDSGNGTEQTFTSAMAQTTCSLLALSAASMIIPATLYSILDSSDQHGKTESILWHSRGTAIILLILYALYLCFQLRTHKNLFSEGSGGTSSLDEEADEPESVMSPWSATAVLVAVTVVISFCADYLVGSIDSIAKDAHTSKSFIGLILIPIVGNAAEHATACVMAVRNKMDLATGVAIGSSIQIALLVTPLLVVLGWAINVPMGLNFNILETVIFAVSVLVVTGTVQDGKSNYLEGAMLAGLYIIIALTFWAIPTGVLGNAAG